MEFHAVELRALCLASEVPEMVRLALATAMGKGEEAREALSSSPGALDDMMAGVGCEEETTRGQFGNRIILMSWKARKAREVRAFWESLRTAAPDIPGALALELEDRLDDENVLHFRLDKQEAWAGRLVLGSGGDTIAVRCKAAVYSGGREGALEGLREFLAVRGL